MALNIGNINELVVKRETDISYTLVPSDDFTNEVFLHFNQATQKLNVGDKVKAFLYYDNKKRLCATMEKPLVTVDKIDFAEVVNRLEGVGCFMKIGISKDILLSTDYLPYNFSAWPKVGTKLPIILKEKKNTLVAKIISKDDINFQIAPLNIGDSVSATICHFSPSGLTCITDKFQSIFIHKNNTRKRYAIGDIIEPKIINVNATGEYNGSLIQNKEVEMISDKDIVLRTLSNFGGTIHLSDSSTPEEISKIFPFSKSAFKRAIGALYKEGSIKIDKNKIVLIKKD